MRVFPLADWEFGSEFESAGSAEFESRRAVFERRYVREVLDFRGRPWHMRRVDRVSAKRISHCVREHGNDRFTSYPALKLSPSWYWLCSFLFLRNLLRMALRRDTRSSSGKGVDEHRESSAL